MEHRSGREAIYSRETQGVGSVVQREDLSGPDAEDEVCDFERRLRDH